MTKAEERKEARRLRRAERNQLTQKVIEDSTARKTEAKQGAGKKANYLADKIWKLNQKKKLIRSKAKKIVQTENKAILDLKEKQKEEETAIRFGELKEAAAKGEISLDINSAKDLLKYLEYSANTSHEDVSFLRVYIKACEQYARMNRVFREFYASDTFKKVICPLYAREQVKGTQPIIIDREHKDVYDFYTRKWINPCDRITGSLDTAEQQFI